MVRIGMNVVGDPVKFAYQLEQLGLDSVWAGDHLANDMPMLDAPLVLAAASAVTTTIELGTVMQLALRPAAWAAKHIGSLQTLSGNRIQLGVGVGGEWPDEWAAAGMSLVGRGRRTDEALKALPSLLAGHPTKTPDTGTIIRMTPPAATPPIWIAGASQRARRRAAELGDGWFPAMVTPEQFRKGLDETRELAEQAGRPAPRGGLQMFGALGGPTDGVAKVLNKQYQMPLELADQVLLGGGPTQIASRLNEFIEAGAEHIVVATFAADWHAQSELLVAAKALL
jgi:alkanesulfonate monooxygenase SsuD/methylene tetrahydromethanopterin reductase-like flavin-dependent oxidoreductase (luciferase family)